MSPFDLFKLENKGKRYLDKKWEELPEFEQQECGRRLQDLEHCKPYLVKKPAAPRKVKAKAVEEKKVEEKKVA